MTNPDTPAGAEQPPAGSPRRTAIGIGLLCLAIAVVAALVMLGPADDEDPAATAAGPTGTRTFDVATRTHVAEAVDYPQTPPVGGDHNPTWWNCGSYDEPIVTEAGVHTLEHGAVWVTYDPTLPPEQVDELDALADTTTYVLVSPWPDEDLPAPIVVSAWGAQLEVEELPDPRIEEFVRAYRQAPTSPEPGAPCTGGASG